MMSTPVIISLPDAIARLQAEPELYLVFDRNVDRQARELQSAVPVKGAFGLDASEQGKTLETVQALCRRLLEAGASRQAFLLAVGGGITTDLAGFAAAIYKRGIRYANFPTTLLAQVDASIGGKTGVNLDGYKNMLGAFRMPEFTILHPRVLETLPEREYKAGTAELLKTFLLADGTLYAEAVRYFAAAQQDRDSGAKSAPNAPGLQKFIEAAAAIKADIVARDPQEHGERAKLNLGHSFGHAIEHLAQQWGDDIHHGEAVAMGIVLAARLSERRNLAPVGLANKLRADFEAIGLPVQCPYPIQALGEAMRNDKKAAGGKVKFILLKSPGEPVMQEITVNEAIDDLRQHTK